MIQVAYASIRELAPAELALLAADEREREFENDERRWQFLCGRWLLRTLLERSGETEAAGRRIDTAEHGKPYIEDGPPFNIAHAGDLAICCVAKSGNVGIDLEFTDTGRNIAGIAERFFSADEVDWLATQPADHFFMLWVLKEAWVKALGFSIFGNMQEPRFRVEPPLITAADSGNRTLHQALFRIENGYLALAVSDDLPANIAIERFDDATHSFVTDAKSQLVART